ncbi:putative sugar transferase EpsL [Corynebacterium durum]|nr:lipopolysaccharide/colanic/teichoic acid biosynthesis glycosyltransferase [Corynebacterium durum]WJY84572.1 putative sugar transferase EpsL [Corynebacterium durum]
MTLSDQKKYSDANGTTKRVFDILLSLIMLILTSPILLVTALAIKLYDGGPAFYLSERIGRDGIPYTLWKFRSMVVDADTKVHELIRQQGGNALLFKMKDDPRLTPIGRFIRTYSIDELPQFINSLNGTMSIVGPRPQVQREVDEYDADMHLRLTIRPGITGLWQVSGRSHLSADEAKRLDLYYVHNWSMLLDMKTIARTVGAVVTHTGAY